MKAIVGIVVGSKSDLPYIKETEKILKENKVSYEVRIISAHRNPEELRRYAQGLKKRGIKVVIAAAGLSAALPGILASYTELPVIGIPVFGEPLKGLDALLSILQMPSGIPLATMPLGKSGPKNAALFALRILKIQS